MNTNVEIADFNLNIGKCIIFQEEHFDVRHNVVARGFQAGAPAPGFKSVAAPVTKPGQDQPDAAGNGFRSVGPSGDFYRFFKNT